MICSTILGVAPLLDRLDLDLAGGGGHQGVEVAHGAPASLAEVRRPPDGVGRVSSLETVRRTDTPDA